MLKAVEPYTEEELENLFNQRASWRYLNGSHAAAALATIEADREKLAEITEQAARQIAASGMAINELKERAEAAEARVSELEKERDWEPINMKHCNGQRLLLWNSKWTAPCTGQHYGYRGWGVSYNNYFDHQPTHCRPVPTPPVKGEG